MADLQWGNLKSHFSRLQELLPLLASQAQA